MANAGKKMRRYIRAIGCRLNMPNDIKKRVIGDFISSIESRKESGQTDEAIFAELGAPKKVAAELNEQMHEYTYTKNPWRWACLALVIVCCAYLIFWGMTNLLLYLFNQSLNHDIGIIGGADGPTAIFITTAPELSQYALYQTGTALLLLIMGALGFLRLSRCPRK